MKTAAHAPAGGKEVRSVGRRLTFGWLPFTSRLRHSKCQSRLRRKVAGIADINAHLRYGELETQLH